MTGNVVLAPEEGRRSVDILNLDAVRTRFENWRQSRPGKQRIPNELWSAAVEVARRDGATSTAPASYKPRRVLLVAAGEQEENCPKPSARRHPDDVRLGEDCVPKGEDTSLAKALAAIPTS